MTQTNTDYLLQITPAVDRTYGAAAASDEPGGFNDHLSQAASFSGDDFQNLSSGSQRTDTARDGRNDSQWNTRDFKPSSRDGGNTITSQTSRTDDEESADTVSGSKPAIEEADNDDPADSSKRCRARQKTGDRARGSYNGR
jgi:hypothetical protein